MSGVPAALILDLVNDVLDLATIDEEQLTLRYEPLEMAEVLGDVVELLRVNADAKNIQLRADLDPACPEWVRGDATRLRQVLINLVGNAVKFTDSGEVTVEVVPAARLEEPEAIYFQVTDTGIGCRPTSSTGCSGPTADWRNPATGDGPAPVSVCRSVRRWSAGWAVRSP